MVKRLKIGVAALAGLLALAFGGAALAGATQGAPAAKKPAARAHTSQTPPAQDTETGDNQGDHEHLGPGETAGGPETPDANETPEANDKPDANEAPGTETNDGPETGNVQQ
jgi:hypothetical protein